MKEVSSLRVDLAKLRFQLHGGRERPSLVVKAKSTESFRF